MTNNVVEQLKIQLTEALGRIELLEKEIFKLKEANCIDIPYKATYESNNDASEDALLEN